MKNGPTPARGAGQGEGPVGAARRLGLDGRWRPPLAAVPELGLSFLQSSIILRTHRTQQAGTDRTPAAHTTPSHPAPPHTHPCSTAPAPTCPTTPYDILLNHGLNA